jgi:heme exporter protein B
MSSVLVFFFQMVQREITIQQRQRRALLNTCLLFVMVIVFFPLTLPADPALLRQIFPGVLWITLLFLLLLSSEALFQQEIDSGTLEQWLIGIYPIHWILRAKLFVIWSYQMVLMLCVSPIFVMMFNLSLQEYKVLLLTCLAGTPTLFMLSALASSFSSGMKQKGVFMGLILLPLSLPVMILASGTLVHAMQGFSVSGELALLLAMSLLSVAFLPWVMGVALQTSML